MTNPFDAAVLDVVNEKLAELDAEPVDGDQLLHDISSFIARYLHCSEHQRTILALWVLHTYTYQAALVTPYLSIQSAEKQSGKTRCLLLLRLLCDYPALTAGFTASSLFRLMKSSVATLLLDECQAGVGTRSRSKAPVLRAILAGGAHNESNRFALHDRNRFCPKAFAGRGPLPEDLADLSIPIILEPLGSPENHVAQPPGSPSRAVSGFARDGVEVPPAVSDGNGMLSAVDQKIERLHLPDATEAVKPLHQQLRIWRTQNLADLKEGPAYLHEDFPPNLSPRRQDMVEPLLQIADLSGGEWPKRIREALVAVFEEQTKFDLQANIQLLADIRDCFAYHGNPDRLSTENIVDWTHSLPTRPWDVDGPLSARKLVRLLSPFEIRPRFRRMSTANAEAKTKPKRGYQLEDFKEPWQKHFLCSSPSAVSEGVPASSDCASADRGPLGRRERSESAKAFESEIANNHAVCSTVAHAGTVSIPVGPDETQPGMGKQLFDFKITKLPTYPSTNFPGVRSWFIRTPKGQGL